MWNAKEFSRVLFSPLQQETFIENFAGRHATHILGTPEKLASLQLDSFAFEELASLLRDCARSEFANGSQPKSTMLWYSKGTEQPHMSKIPLSTGEASFAIEQGHPSVIIVEHLERTNTWMADLAGVISRALRLHSSSVPTLGVTYGGQAGLGSLSHLEVEETLHITLRGQVRWNIETQRAQQNQEVFECGPGDIVYLPEGSVHTTETMSDQGSLVLTFSAAAMSRYQALERLLQLLISSDISREPLFRRAADAQETEDKLGQTVNDAFATLQHAVQSKDARIHQALLTPTNVSPTTTPEASSAELNANTRLRKTFIQASLEQRGDSLVLHTSGNSFSFEDRRFWPLISMLHETFGVFIANEARSWTNTNKYPWHEIEPFLQQLLAASLLEIASS